MSEENVSPTPSESLFPGWPEIAGPSEDEMKAQHRDLYKWAKRHGLTIGPWRHFKPEGESPSATEVQGSYRITSIGPGSITLDTAVNQTEPRPNPTKP